MNKSTTAPSDSVEHFIDQTLPAPKVCMLDLFPSEITHEILFCLKTEKDIRMFISLTEKLQKRYEDENLWNYFFIKRIGGKIAFQDASILYEKNLLDR
jgi:hypothetical protein